MIVTINTVWIRNLNLLLKNGIMVEHIHIHNFALTGNWTQVLKPLHGGPWCMSWAIRLDYYIVIHIASETSQKFKNLEKNSEINQNHFQIETYLWERTLKWMGRGGWVWTRMVLLTNNIEEEVKKPDTKVKSVTCENSEREHEQYRCY